jgi:hypothetical protein
MVRFGDVDDFYSNFYERTLRQGSIGRAQDRTHKAMEKIFTRDDIFNKVLEVGSGFGDHLPFVRHGFSEYVQTDIRAMPQVQPLTIRDSTILNEIADVTDLPYKEKEFDRCIATCLLLHLEDPESALLELRRVAKRPHGQITLLVPCEPGILLRLARKLLTERKAARLGFPGYSLFNVRDHVTYFLRIHRLIKYVFRDDSITVSRKPFGFPSWNFNFYYVYQIKLCDS